jgi:hypothetical protein
MAKYPQPDTPTESQIESKAPFREKAAAICAKFMLMGRVFHMGDRFKKLPLIVPTLQRCTGLWFSSCC